MRDLSVFDLDGTLIMVDSFARLVRREARRPRVALAAALRASRLLDGDAFAARAHAALGSVLADPAYVARFLDEMEPHLDRQVVGRIGACRSDGHLLVLVSASPDDYVRPFAKRLGFDEAHGSRHTAGGYRRLHGPEKLRLVDESYPREHFRRVFAIGDSDSDMALFATFERHELIRR